MTFVESATHQSSVPRRTRSLVVLGSFMARLGLAALLTLLGATQARAQDYHFIAEAELGMVTPLGARDGSPGVGTGLLLGAGGKILGLPLRAYLIAELGWGSFSVAACEGPLLPRTMWQSAVGARVLLPVTAGIRVFGDVSVGLFWLAGQRWSEVHGGELPLDGSTGRASVGGALGVQARPLPWFSVGGGVEVAGLLSGPEIGPGDMEGWLKVLATLTLHF